MAPFYGWGSTVSRQEPLRGGNLLLPKGYQPGKNNSILKYEKQRKGKFSNKSISLIIFLFNGILDYSDLYFCY